MLTDTATVRRLLAAQFPRWAQLPLVLVDSWGTDHDVYRLGAELSVRMPRTAWATDQAAKERRWLPVLAPHLPVAVPEQLAAGEPGAGYPFRWSVYRWVAGRCPERAVDDLDVLAGDLARFVLALRAVGTQGAPPLRPGARGAALADLDEGVRGALERLGDRVDGAAVLRLWEESLAAPPHAGPGRWLHGDLLPGNLLVRDGRLGGVIDFGALGVGDPACDLQPVWNVFEGPSRRRFLDGLAADAASVLRGRGWTIAQTVVALPHHWDTNPGLVRQASRALAAVLADPRP